MCMLLLFKKCCTRPLCCYRGSSEWDFILLSEMSNQKYYGRCNALHNSNALGNGFQQPNTHTAFSRKCWVFCRCNYRNRVKNIQDHIYAVTKTLQVNKKGLQALQHTADSLSSYELFSKDLWLFSPRMHLLQHNHLSQFAQEAGLY